MFLPVKFNWPSVHIAVNDGIVDGVRVGQEGDEEPDVVQLTEVQDPVVDPDGNQHQVCRDHCDVEHHCNRDHHLNYLNKILSAILTGNYKITVKIKFKIKRKKFSLNLFLSVFPSWKIFQKNAHQKSMFLRKTNKQVI